MKYRPDLIFDIGMHDGKDTEYYLHRGFNVVAVDANPLFCQEAAQRWAKEIQAGRLSIENVAIGENRGKLPFYISSKSIWSSTDREEATRDGCTCTTIEIDYVRAGDLFAKYGVPYYLKIDIEGADTHCLRDLPRGILPQFISFERGPNTQEDVKYLAGIGYSRFKLISQYMFLFAPPNETASGVPPLKYRLRHKLRNVLRGHWKDPWTFEIHSSGPFGDDTDGNWVSAEKLLQLFDEWKKLDKEFWYDIHAGR